jgi:hypothetical protein
METNSQLEFELERLIAEIVDDPEVRAQMLKIQPIDVEMN